MIVWVLYDLVDGTVNGERELVDIFDDHDTAVEYAEARETAMVLEDPDMNTAWDIDRIEVVPKGFTFQG